MRRLQFKFLSQIRISGWDFGSSARAMNQAGGFISTQADLEKVSRSTTERKSMSTKTTIKRIALVAVSALGLGMFAAVSPASAAYTASMTLNTTSLTVVTDTAARYGYVRIAITDNAGNAAQLGTGESITAQVTAWPTSESSTAVNDLVYSITKRTGTGTDNVTRGTWAAATAPGCSAGSSTCAINEWTQGSDSSPDVAGNQAAYYLGIGMASGLRALDRGTYTVRLRLTDSNGFITDKTVKVKFVTSPADSGAAITLTVGGVIRTSESITYGADNYLKATLRDENGGLIQTGVAAGAGPGLPVLKAALWAGSTSAEVDASTKFYVTDTGTSGYDHYSSDATWATSESATAVAGYGDGVYGIRTFPNQLPTLTAASVSPKLRVTYGSTAVTAAVTVLGAVSGSAGTPVLSAANSSTLVVPSNGLYVPLATKKATYKTTGTAGAAYSYSVAWTKCTDVDATPDDSTPTTIYADSSGVITFDVTCANPVDGTAAAITMTGFSTNPSTQTVTWKGNNAYGLSVSLSGAYVALKSSNTFVATVTDVFGSPVAGVSLLPSWGSTTSSNYSAAGFSPVVTGADGTASVTITDAAAVAAGTDKLTFSHNATTALFSAVSSTITYAATAPAPTSLTATYSTTPGDALTAITTAVPSTGIYYTGTTGFDLANTRNTNLAVTAAAGNELVIKIATGVAGSKVTATASTGAYILNSINFEASTVSKYAGSTGLTSFVVGTHKTGANTITFTSGTATTTVSFWGEDTDAATARFVTLTKGDGDSVIAKVTDRWGNGVPSASLQISTSVGTLGNGQVTTSYNTDASGSVTFVPVGGQDTVITAYAVTSQAGYTSLAGYVDTTAVNSTLAAGNRTATLSVRAKIESSDAIDAANEATDAANAATDAANAAAEAADAATAAAQDAQAAVAALASQVADLIAGIKAQITALTNLVIKIQKKVKA